MLGFESGPLSGMHRMVSVPVANRFTLLLSDVLSARSGRGEQAASARCLYGWSVEKSKTEQTFDFSSADLEEQPVEMVTQDLTF